MPESLLKRTNSPPKRNKTIKLCIYIEININIKLKDKFQPKNVLLKKQILNWSLTHPRSKPYLHINTVMKRSRVTHFVARTNLDPQWTCTSREWNCVRPQGHIVKTGKYI